MSNQEKEALLAEIHNLKLEKDDLSYKLEYVKQSRDAERIRNRQLSRDLAKAKMLMASLKREMRKR